MLIEYDRTGKGAKQREKLRRYDWFLAEGWRNSRFAAEWCEPAVLFVCSAEAKTRTVLEAADRELSAGLFEHSKRNPMTSQDPEGDDYPGRSQIGVTSIERLKGGNHEILQAPLLPPHRRKRPGSPASPCHPQTSDFAIHQLFVADKPSASPSS